MAAKDYDALRGLGAPGPSFRLGGRLWHCRSADDVPFRATKVFAVSAEDDVAGVLVQVDSFFADLLVPAELTEFRAMLDAEDSPLTVGILTPLMTDLATAMLAPTPTTPAGASSNGSRRTGRSSGAPSSSRATRRAPSPG